MDCPKCSQGILKPTKLKSKDIELDRCQACKGLWFDDTELYTVLGVKAKKTSIPRFAMLNKNIKCPKCKQGLYEFCYPGTIILVDVCKSCSGIWLDQDEWKEINSAKKVHNQFYCPKCGVGQDKMDSCINCGVVFAKLSKRKIKKREEGKVPIVRKSRSYAEKIPGIKGQLLRFIDDAINRLTNY